jgi:hypothetical protein
LLHAEIADHYPTLAKLAKITIYDVAPNILGSFDKTLVECVLKFLEVHSLDGPQDTPRKHFLGMGSAFSLHTMLKKSRLEKCSSKSREKVRDS